MGLKIEYFEGNQILSMRCDTCERSSKSALSLPILEKRNPGWALWHNGFCYLVACNNCTVKSDSPFRPVIEESIEIKSDDAKNVNACELCGSSLVTGDQFCSYDCAQKARRKVIRPDADTLKRLIWQKPTTDIAHEFGVSDKAVSKWCNRYKIEKPPRGYWAKLYAKKGKSQLPRHK